MDSTELLRRPRFFHSVWFPIARVIATIFFFVFGPVRVMGRSRFPKGKGVLVLSNHVSDLDPPLVMYSAGYPIRFMAKSELFEMNGVGPVLRFFGAFPVKRGEPDRNSIRFAVDLLKAGEAVGIFPEGQLSEDSQLQELKAGVALVIRMARCPVICCGIDGANRALPYGSLIPRPAFRTIHVRWGEPRTFSSEASADEILDWVRQELLDLSSGNGRR